MDDNYDKENEDDEKINEVKYYTRQGNYEYFYYTSRTVQIDKEYTDYRLYTTGSVIITVQKYRLIAPRISV